MADRLMARVLVAEDVEASRVALELELADAGFEVHGCAGGEEALRLLADDGFDALVTDLWMPDGDGIALLRELQQGARRNLLIYAVTGGGPGMPMAAAASLARIWNASRVFLKPFSVADLVAALREDLAVSR